MSHNGRKRLGKMPQRNGRGRTIRRLLLSALVVAVCGLSSWLGWSWISSVPVHEVAISAPGEIQENEIRALVQVDTLQRLYDLKTEDIRNSVGVHPWVEEVAVGRIPNGTLRVDVERRTPVARMVDPSGQPGAYLDRSGHILPDTENTAFNVPLIRGVPGGLEKIDPDDQPVLSELLTALERLDPRADALLSEIQMERKGVAIALLTPAAGQGSVRVILGDTGFQNKFSCLSAFWEQAVITSYPGKIREIDLRFDSQIVVRTL